MRLKVGDYITINKREEGIAYIYSGYACCSSRPGMAKCLKCDFYKEKPCKIIEVSEGQIKIELNVNCGRFYGSEKRFSEHFIYNQKFRYL